MYAIASARSQVIENMLEDRFCSYNDMDGTKVNSWTTSTGCDNGKVDNGKYGYRHGKVDNGNVDTDMWSSR